jgi:hypothetical protein
LLSFLEVAVEVSGALKDAYSDSHSVGAAAKTAFIQVIKSTLTVLEIISAVASGTANSMGARALLVLSFLSFSLLLFQALSLSASLHDFSLQHPLSFRSLYCSANTLPPSILLRIMLAIYIYYHESNGELTLAFRDTFAAFMSVASLLARMRIFDLVRGNPQMGFYSKLIIESFYDVRFFLVLLIVVVGAFATAGAALIHGTTEDDDIGPLVFIKSYFWHLTTPFGINPLDDGDYSGSMRLTGLYNILLCLFILLVPVVMLNMLVSILGTTYENVTEAKFRVALKQQVRASTHTHPHISTLCSAVQIRSIAFTFSLPLSSFPSDGNLDQSRGDDSPLSFVCQLLRWMPIVS